MKKIKLTVGITLFTLISFCFSAFSQNTFWTVAKGDNLFRLIDLNSSTIINSIPITIPGDSVVQGIALALHPLSGEVYALLSLNGQTGRELVTINTVTGVATKIGNTGDSFAAITFTSSGFLYGVTGDGAMIGERLYAIDASTAATTLVMALGNGDDGETIAFNPDDGLIYHASGIDGGRIFESTNSIAAPINIPLSGSVYDEATALHYTGNGNFILASFNSFYSITTSGVVTAIDSLGLGFTCKGIIDANTTVAIDDNSENLSNDFKIYPNPSTGGLHKSTYFAQQQNKYL